MKTNCEARGRRKMKFACGILGMILALLLIGPSAWGQTTDSTAADKAAAAARQEAAYARVDTRPYQTFYLANATQQNDANEVVIAVRNMVDPNVKIYLVPSQNAIAMRGTPDQLALAQKVINDIDRPKKAYRLTYSISEMEGGKRIGVQHFAMIVTAGQRTQLKQGNKIPIATGSYGAAGSPESQTQTQFTYIDIGMNFDSTLDTCGNGGRLKSKVEQLGIPEEKSGVGPQDPIVRQTVLEGTSFLTPGKPVILGSLDIPGSTRHLDVDVMMEPLAQ